MSAADVASSRREALRRAAVGAGAIAAAGLVRPTAAGAQGTTGDEDLRDFLVEAVALEQLAVLAYEAAAKQADADLRETLERFRDQEQAHATALRAALDTLGFDPPPVPSSLTDSAAFEGVEGLDEEASRSLVRALEELDGLSGTGAFLRYLLSLESDQLSYYAGPGAEVESVDLTTTNAEIAGCEAQHALVLGEALGQDPARAAAEPARVAADAVPAS